MNKNWKPEYANLPKAPWLEEIDFVTFSDKREQDRILSSIDTVSYTHLRAHET